MKCTRLFLLVLFFSLCRLVNAQIADLSVSEWAKKLSDRSDRKNEWHDELYPVLVKLDSSQTFHFLNQLSLSSRAKENYFLARFNCIKAEMIYIKNLEAPNDFVFRKEEAKTEILSLLKQAMRKTYESNDDYLAAFVSGVYGRHLSAFDETEPAVMYMMNSADLYEKLNLSAAYTIYVVVGEMLWRVREYQKSLKYSSKALTILDTSHFELRDDYLMMCQNTVGLTYHRMGQYDSAFVHYNGALDMATKNNKAAWQGIISGNMAQIYFAQGKYTAALPLFTKDYTISNEKGYYDNAANSLQWAARTNLALGNTNVALQQVRTAFELLHKWPAANYLQNAYFTASEVFKTLKNDDSSFYYSGLYNQLHDSLEKVIYQSSVSISKLRVDDEKNRYDILNLQREKQAQVQQRNLVIAVILFLAILALLLINRQRLKLKYRQKLLEQDKLRVEQEMESARAELKMFTQNIVEKTILIEKLEQQMKAHEYDSDEHRLIEELSNQTILTEDDWLKFKTLFEKTHPGFFAKVKEKANDITLAEQRMAALTRLSMTTKQMAAVLGISSNSVIKAKQRLRQRFNFETDFHVEDFLLKL